jgi:hypothetical protein
MNRPTPEQLVESLIVLAGDMLKTLVAVTANDYRLQLDEIKEAHKQLKE